jgi:hypothetical protein
MKRRDLAQNAALLRLAEKPLRPSFWRRSVVGLLGDHFTPILISLLTAGLVCVALWLLTPQALHAWNGSIGFLLNWLQVPAHAVAAPCEITWGVCVSAPAIGMDAIAPQPSDYAIHAGIGIGGLLLSLCLRRPLRTVIRLAALLHLFCTLVSAALPGTFPYTMETYSGSLSVLTIMLILAVPWMQAAMHFIVESSHERRLIAMALALAYLIAALPFKLVAHALAIHLLSPLAMPTLFVLFGPTLDILALCALYAWALSWREAN